MPNLFQVDGLTIEYRETEGSTIVQAHGTTADPSGKLDTGLKQEVITLRGSVSPDTLKSNNSNLQCRYSGNHRGHRNAWCN
jgi:hypothetical protein